MSEKENLINFINGKVIQDPDVEVTEDTPLFESKLLDSMNILDLIGYVENEIGRELNDEEIVMKNFQDVNSIIEEFFK